MKPSNEELEAANLEELEAQMQFSKALGKKTKAEVEIMATRKRLMLARAAKNALYQDLQAYTV